MFVEICLYLKMKYLVGFTKMLLTFLNFKNGFALCLHNSLCKQEIILLLLLLRAIIDCLMQIIYIVLRYQP